MLSPRAAVRMTFTLVAADVPGAMSAWGVMTVA
jgi:hypothetical protein